MANYLITGAAGFIGSHLVHALVQQGHQVRGFDNCSTGSRENLQQVGPGFELVEGDLRDADAVKTACAGVDFVLHHGALPSVPRSVTDPRTSHEANLNGTFNVLEGARAAGVRRVVYAASSSAYGNQPGFPRVETMRPEPVSPYAVQKLAGEFYMQSYWRIYGLETVCLRYFNIFGPRQDPESLYAGVVPKFIWQMLRSEQPAIFGDGGQSRDFTYVDNAVQANLLTVEARSSEVAGQIFNVACGERHTLNEMLSVLSRLTGYKGDVLYRPDRRGDVRDSLADINAARKALGYQPAVGFEEGLRRTVAWYKTAGGHEG